jgi:outer membrane protein OmpA-like peptidoglycan-associated protein
LLSASLRPTIKAFSMSSSAPLLRTATDHLLGLLACLLVVVLTSACASKSSLPSSGSSGVFSAPAPNAGAGDRNAAPRAPTPGTPSATPLATEQRFLEDWFRNTPVVIAAQPPVTLQLDVPLANSFDTGKADIKPALNAVLDRVAQSLLRQNASRIHVNAPADAGGNGALAISRAQRVREALGTKGIATTRVAVTEAAPRVGGPVQLRLTIPTAGSQPIARSKGDAGSASKASPVQPAGWTEKKN